MRYSFKGKTWKEIMAQGDKHRMEIARRKFFTCASNKEIAFDLGICKTTVDWHLWKIRLQVKKSTDSLLS